MGYKSPLLSILAFKGEVFFHICSRFSHICNQTDQERILNEIWHVLGRPAGSVQGKPLL